MGESSEDSAGKDTHGRAGGRDASANAVSESGDSREAAADAPENLKCTPENLRNRIARNGVDFRATRAYGLIREFLFQVTNSVKTEPQREPEIRDPYIDALQAIVVETPLSCAPSRYANAAMRDVIDAVHELTTDPYVRASLGNRTRMDFGTGHELNFLCYLYTRVARGVLAVPEVSTVLHRYFRVVRAYITRFNVEAAGARGCWSLDDYQLLPYVLGAAENIGDLRPVEELSSGMFREAWEHRGGAGMLQSVCRLGWPELSIGLLKMYDEEVLGKHVVTQHFIYSEYLPEK